VKEEEEFGVDLPYRYRDEGNHRLSRLDLQSVTMFQLIILSR
jgi:hypothetical protein